jgi:hypothetical protein
MLGDEMFGRIIQNLGGGESNPLHKVLIIRGSTNQPWQWKFDSGLYQPEATQPPGRASTHTISVNLHRIGSIIAQ